MVTTKWVRRNESEPSEHSALKRLKTTRIHSACAQPQPTQHTQHMRTIPGERDNTDTALFLLVSLCRHLLQRPSTVSVNTELFDKNPFPPSTLQEHPAPTHTHPSHDCGVAIKGLESQLSSPSPVRILALCLQVGSQPQCCSQGTC